MTEDFYVIVITALLPLTAGLLVLQKNPYHALVIRGILGAIAAMVYALFGAADVALTEALVGTMLSITLYAVAVRSSMSMRLGVLKPALGEPELALQSVPSEQLLSDLTQALNKYHMRLELSTYPTFSALNSAIAAKEIHAAYGLSNESANTLTIRVQRLYQILQAELPATVCLRSLSSPSTATSTSKPLTPIKDQS
ncbi:MAG: DUF4040 domain-containing protein [Phormidesmis sp.]